MKAAYKTVLFIGILVFSLYLTQGIAAGVFGKGNVPAWANAVCSIGSLGLAIAITAFINRRAAAKIKVPPIVFYETEDEPQKEVVAVDLGDSPFKAPENKPRTWVRNKDPYEGFVVVDVETTGLNPGRNKIIEIAAIKVMDIKGDNHKGFSTLVKISTKVPDEITKITGITDQMLKDDGAELEEVMKYFAEFVEDLPIVAYNAEFDRGFIRAAAQKVGIEHENEYHCALKMMRAAWPGRMSYKLSSVTEFTELANEPNHRALGDCKKTFKVYAACLEKLGQPIRI